MVSEQHINNWVEGCRQGDRKSQESVYRHFYEAFMPVCMSYVQNTDDAIDIYNRSMLKVFRSLDRYEGTGAFGAWVRRIVVNSAIDFVRQNKKLMMQTPIEDAPEVGEDAHILSEMTSREILTLIQELPSSQRIVFNLFVIEGNSHNEIAEQLDISVGTSKWHLNQARKLIQKKIYDVGILTK